MIDINRLIDQLLQDPFPDVRIEAARELALTGRKTRRACSAVWRCFTEAADQAEVRTMRDVLASLDPTLVRLGERRRRSSRDRQSYQEVAKGYDAERARVIVDDLLTSLRQEKPFKDCTPESFDESTVVSRHDNLEALGLEVPTVIPVLLDALAEQPALRDMLAWILGRIGRERRVVGELAVPLLLHDKPSVVDAAAGVIGDVGDVGDRIDDAIRGLVYRYLGQRATAKTASCYALRSLAASKYEQEVKEAVCMVMAKEPEGPNRMKLEKLLKRIARPTLSAETRWKREVDLAIQDELLGFVHSAALAAKQVCHASRQTQQAQLAQLLYGVARKGLRCMKTIHRRTIVALRSLGWGQGDR